MTAVPRLLMSDTRPLYRYIRLGLLMLGWLIVLEIVLRLPPVKTRLDRYADQPVWYSPYVPQRIKLIRDNPDADIWFVGSSSVIQGLNPAVIDPLLNNQTTTKHKSLNLGLYGMLFIDHIETYLNNAFLPEGTPKVVVLGIFPIMFAYTPIAYGNEYEATRNHSTELDRQVSGWLYDRLAIYKLVYTFRYLIAENPISEIKDTPTGYIGTDQTMTNVVPTKAKGTTNDLLEKNLILVKHLHDALQVRGVQLFFINMPLNDPEMRQYPGGISNYRAYISRLNAFSAAEHIPFLDVWQALEDANNNQLPTADFMDYVHLNNKGAKAIAPFVADFLARNLDSVTK